MSRSQQLGFSACVCIARRLLLRRTALTLFGVACFLPGCTEAPELAELAAGRAELVALQKTYPRFRPHLERTMAGMAAKVAESKRAGSVRDERKLLREGVALLEGPVAGRLRRIHVSLGRVSNHLKEATALQLPEGPLQEQLAHERTAAETVHKDALERLTADTVPSDDEGAGEYLDSIEQSLGTVERGLARWIKTARASREVAAPKGPSAEKQK